VDDGRAKNSYIMQVGSKGSEHVKERVQNSA
jgi:hypothetical protein